MRSPFPHFSNLPQYLRRSSASLKAAKPPTSTRPWKTTDWCPLTSSWKYTPIDWCPLPNSWKWKTTDWCPLTSTWKCKGSGRCPLTSSWKCKGSSRCPPTSTWKCKGSGECLPLKDIVIRPFGQVRRAYQRATLHKVEPLGQRHLLVVGKLFGGNKFDHPQMLKGGL